MSDQPEPRTIDVDVRSLRAVAHPLRVRILQQLETDGPATSAILAKELGESTGTLSWHLRLLAKHGLVEEDPDRGTRRERWWRVPAGTLNVEAHRFADHPELWGTVAGFARANVAWHFRLVTDFLAAAERRELSPEWLDAAGFTSTITSTTRMSPGALRAMRDELLAVVGRHVDAAGAGDPGPDAAHVVALTFAFPHRLSR